MRRHSYAALAMLAGVVMMAGIALADDAVAPPTTPPTTPPAQQITDMRAALGDAGNFTLLAQAAPGGQAQGGAPGQQVQGSGILTLTVGKDGEVTGAKGAMPKGNVTFRVNPGTPGAPGAPAATGGAWGAGAVTGPAPATPVPAANTGTFWISAAPAGNPYVAAPGTPVGPGGFSTARYSGVISGGDVIYTAGPGAPGFPHPPLPPGPPHPPIPPGPMPPVPMPGVVAGTLAVRSAGAAEGMPGMAAGWGNVHVEPFHPDGPEGKLGEMRMMIGVMSDPTISAMMAVGKIKELALQTKQYEAGQKTLLRVAEASNNPAVKHAAVFALAEVAQAGGDPKAAFEALARVAVGPNEAKFEGRLEFKLAPQGEPKGEPRPRDLPEPKPFAPQPKIAPGEKGEKTMHPAEPGRPGEMRIEIREGNDGRPEVREVKPGESGAREHGESAPAPAREGARERPDNPPMSGERGDLKARAKELMDVNTVIEDALKDMEKTVGTMDGKMRDQLRQQLREQLEAQARQMRQRLEAAQDKAREAEKPKRDAEPARPGLRLGGGGDKNED
jgi:hypothetical protein